MIRTLKRFLARLFRQPPPMPGQSDDPFAGVREPRRIGPGGRGSSVAVMEPRSDEMTQAVGQPRRRG